MSLGWSDTEGVAQALQTAHPDVDPITVRFIDLDTWSRRLAGFASDAPPPEPRQLEAIQALWYESIGRG